jgi:predicted AAA+ superfamily ATPase
MQKSKTPMVAKVILELLLKNMSQSILLRTMKRRCKKRKIKKMASTMKVHNHQLIPLRTKQRKKKVELSIISRTYSQLLLTMKLYLNLLRWDMKLKRRLQLSKKLIVISIKL